MCGDRNWTDAETIADILLWFRPHIIIEGAARGADRLSGVEARYYGIQVHEFPAEWTKYGKSAGIIRNRQMLDEEPDLVIAFHDDIEHSAGTGHTLEEAERRGITYALISHWQTLMGVL